MSVAAQYENEALRVVIEDRGIRGGTITEAHSKPEPGYSVVYDPEAHTVAVSGQNASQEYSDHDFIDLVGSIMEQRGVIRTRQTKTAAMWLEIGESMIAVAILTLKGQEALNNDIR